MGPLLRVPPEARSWDLAVSLYEDIEVGSDARIEFLHYKRGGKWDGIFAFFAERSELIAKYDYFWLVDDDIEATPAQVEDLFAYVRSHAFELAQPALTFDSYYSHRLTLSCPGFAHRHSNFVEIMAPILARNVLKVVLPYFAHTRSGLGMDWFWHRCVERPGESVAIIDAVAVAHRRPLRQHLRGKMREDGVCPDLERERLVQKLKVGPVYAVATRGVLADGGEVCSRCEMAWRMTKGYWEARRLMTARPWRAGDFAVFLWRQAFL